MAVDVVFFLELVDVDDVEMVVSVEVSDAEVVLAGGGAGVVVLGVMLVVSLVVSEGSVELVVDSGSGGESEVVIPVPGFSSIDGVVVVDGAGSTEVGGKAKVGFGMNGLSLPKCCTESTTTMMNSRYG